MKKCLVLVLMIATLLTGCEEEDPFALPRLENNELSSQWDGIYHGTCVLSLGGSSSGSRRPVMLRIIDVGDNYIRIQAFLDPIFRASEQTRLELLVNSGNLCRRQINVDQQWWFGSFNRSGDRVRGSISVYPVGGSVSNPDWTIGGIDAVRDSEDR